MKWEDRKNKKYLPHEVQRLVPAGVYGQMSTLSNTNVERLLPVLPEDVQKAIRDTAISKPFKALTIRKRQDAN